MNRRGAGCTILLLALAAWYLWPSGHRDPHTVAPATDAAPGQRTPAYTAPASPGGSPHTTPPTVPRGLGTQNRTASSGATQPAPLTPPDPAEGLPVLALREEPVKGTNAIAMTRRVRVVRADFKYPLWRVEETLAPNENGGLAVVTRTVAVADHVMVQFHADVDAAAVGELAARHGLTIRKATSTPGLYLLAAPTATPETVPDLLRRLGLEARVRFAEPDYIVSAVATLPNDASFAQLWGLHNTGQSGGTADADIDAPEAWDLGTGSTNTVVAVIDTGIDYTHPDLAANIWSNPLEVVNGADDDGNGYVDDIHGWDFYSEDAVPMDDNGHGSHCAGTIGGLGNNSVGVAGVNWSARIVPLRFLNSGGNGSTSDAIEALNYAVKLRRNGINIRLTSNSWGGGGAEQALEDAIIANRDAGLLFIAAAGNWGWNNDASPFYPSSYPQSNIIAVAATDRNDSLAGFSHYGLMTVDLGAPGVEIYSTLNGGSYGNKSGTSMATPHVAGVAALLAGLAPSADGMRIRQAILAGVDPLASLSGRTVTGGRLNALGAIRALANIAHTPLPNTYVTNAAYAVDATIAPLAIMDTNTFMLHWNTDGSPNVFDSVPFSPLSGDSWRALIPAQPYGVTVYYWIDITTLYGTDLRSPAGAPASMHSFRVAAPLPLMVFGSPGDYDTVTPSYGNHMYPSGEVVQAQAPAHTVPDGDGTARWRCTGWVGMGSVPPTGTGTTFTLTLSTYPSILVWQWNRQYALAQTSSVPGAVNQVSWWDTGSSGETVQAPARHTLGGTNYAFASWLLDKARMPDPTNVAANPVAGIPMTASHAAVALYLPESRDQDADGLPDWWELFYFGSPQAAPSDDPDGDGVPNSDEYGDRSNPRDPALTPQAPAIVHEPLADPQPAPAPYTIEATVTDNYTVASVRLRWSRSGGPELETNMAPVGAQGRYRAMIPAPGTNLDTFVYRIVASDPAGNTTTNGPHAFLVNYPVMRVSPAVLDNVVLRPDTSTVRDVTIENGGTTTLVASLELNDGGLADDMERGVGGWTHSGAADRWTLASRRWQSPSNAWYCGDATSGVYASAMRAGLYSAPLYVPPQSFLTFRYWIQTELDKRNGRSGYAWDGGIMEVSTNNGASFTQIVPAGGYPFRISGWNGMVGEAWPEGTPCFAGTGQWQTATFDLGAFAGRWLTLRFHFGSDGNTEEEGWYVDDIAVAANGLTNDWISFTPDYVQVEPDGVVTVTVTASSAGIATGDRAALLRIANNTPVTPVFDLPVYMRVRSPASLAAGSAYQSSSNAEGYVTIGTAVSDRDGDPCALEVLWSTNAGAAWASAWITTAGATTGALSVVNLSTPQVGGIMTRLGAGLITNTVSSVWDSSTPAALIRLCGETLVQCRAWDGYFWSDPVTSQPFLVDNEAPPAPADFASPSHLTNTWCTNRVLQLCWSPADDGAGIGIGGYKYGAFTDVGIFTLTSRTAGVTASVTTLYDGANWQAAVQSVDRYGNASPAVLLGKFWIDGTPPSTNGAVVTVTRNPYGNYAIGPAVDTAWAGFGDAASGIAGYLAAFTNDQGIAGEGWITNTSATLLGALMDATNRVQVWARDAAGLVSAPISATVLVLSPSGDWDRDGQLNAHENVAATDATRAESALRLSTLVTNDGEGAVFVVRWPSATNRTYALSYAGELPETGTVWEVFGDAGSLPGLPDSMSYTDRTAVVPARFYRISVEQP